MTSRALATGPYRVDVWLNSLLEAGAANNSLATAIDLAPGFIALASGADRAAVIGATNGSATSGKGKNATTSPIPDLYAFHLPAGQNATIVVNSLGGESLGLSLLDASGTVVATSLTDATNVSAYIDNFTAPGRPIAVISNPKIE